MTNPPLPRPSEPTCRKCGHPASDSVHGLFSGGCLETEAGIYRHALTESRVRERQALDAHAASFSALAAISEFTELGGEVDDYADVVRAVERLRRVCGWINISKSLTEDALELRWMVSRTLLLTSNFDVFQTGIDHARKEFAKYLGAALPDSRGK